MDQKIQELATKIYEEGVHKAEARAQEVMAEGRTQAEKELATAKQEAARIVAEARRQADEVKRTMEAELRLSAQQALSAAKQKILDSVVATTVEGPVASSLSNAAFVSDLIKLVVSRWNPASGEAPSLEVLLPEDKRVALEAALKADLSALLGKGVKVSWSRTLKGGLQVSQSGRGFKVSLTDEDFKEFFKEFLRPRARAFLFGA
jgi:V/A-type H+-transporting ATPase subunit E